MSYRNPLGSYNSFAYDNGTSPFNSKTQHIHLHGGSLLSIKSHPFGPYSSPGIWSPPPKQLLKGRGGFAAALIKTLGNKALQAAAKGSVKLGERIFKRAKQKAKKKGQTILKNTAKTATKKVDALANRAISKIGNKVDNLSAKTLQKVDTIIPTDTKTSVTNKRKSSTNSSIKNKRVKLSPTDGIPTSTTKQLSTNTGRIVLRPTL